jgi:DNA-binding MarR family transcriptional regulator
MKVDIRRKNSNKSQNNKKKGNHKHNTHNNDNIAKIHNKNDKKNNRINNHINTCNCNYNHNCNCSDGGAPCYCLDIRKASHNVTKLYTKALKPIELTVTQFGILKHIRSMEPVNVTNLAKNMGLDRTTLVRSLKIIENKGLIEDISEDKARNRKLMLSKIGNKKAAKATMLWNDVQKKIESYLGKEDLQKLLELIFKLENI